MPRPKPDITPKALVLRLEPELLAAVDKARGDTPRSVYIRRAIREEMARDKGIDFTVGDYVRKVLKPAVAREATAFAEDVMRGVQFGPTKTAPGSRLPKPKPRKG